MSDTTTEVERTPASAGPAAADRGQRRRLGRKPPKKAGAPDRNSLIGHHPAQPYALSAPAVFMVLTLLAFPVLYAVWGSLHDSTTIGGGQEFVGLAQYTDLFTTQNFIDTIVRTGIFVLGCLLLGMTLAVYFAFALNKALGGLRFLRGLTILPYVVSGVAAAVMFRLLFNEEVGWVNTVISWFGISGPSWFTSTTLAMVVVIVGQVWTDLPLAILFILGGLQTIDPNLLDAADVDGATGLQRAMRVSMPLVTPQIVLATIWFSYSVATSLGVVLALTGGGPVNATRTLPVALYQTAFQEFDTNEALAIVVIVLLINALLTLAYVGLARRFDIGD